MSSTTLSTQSGLSLTGEQPARWIISRGQDLTWFIGSALAGYLALGLMAAGAPIFPIALFWLLLVDGPHVLSTVTRTYCDKAERARLGWFLWIPAPLMLVGPLMAWAGQASLFFLLAVCWQHFHIVKQHFGFMMLYKAKNGERDRHEFLLDRWFLLTSLFVPLGLFVLRTQASLSGMVPLHWLAGAAVGGYVVLALVWLAWQVRKFRAGTPMNWPKVGLLAVVVPLQWLALLHASQYGPGGIIRAGIALGLFHSFQYHRLMWFHNHNRYTQPGAGERNGLAAWLATSAPKYVAVAIGLHFTLSYLPQVLFPSQTIQAAIWGIAFAHYMLDARIWHVRSDHELAAALRMR
jgi:hypothetical protein